MISVIGAGAFSIVIILSFLIICGLPMGELTMGGQYKVFPPKLRILLIIQIILQMFFVLIILQMGEFVPLFFSHNVDNCFANVSGSISEHCYGLILGNERFIRRK